MFGTVKKVLAAGAVLAVASAAAQAQTTVKFDQPNMGFGSGLIVVESTDGKKWSKINSTNIKLPMAIFIGVNDNDHKLSFYSIHQDGKMIYHESIGIYFDYNPYMKSVTKEVSTSNFNSITRSNLLSACNSRLKAAGDINKDQHMYFKVPLMLYAKIFRDNGTWYAKTAYGHSMVPVVCKAYPKRVPPAPMQITSVKFEAYAQNNNALGIDRCPKQRVVRVKFEGSREGKVSVLLSRDDGKLTEHKVPVSKPGAHYQYFVLESAWIKESETRKYYMVVKGHKISIGWKTVAIDCTTVSDTQSDLDIAVEPTPDPSAPKPNTNADTDNPTRPQIIVRPTRPVKPVRPTVNLATPKLKCVGGKVKRNICYCKPSYKKLKVAKHTYRCVKMTTNKAPQRARPHKKKRKVVSQNRQQTSLPTVRLFKKDR